MKKNLISYLAATALMVVLAVGSYAQKQGSGIGSFNAKSSLLLPDSPVNAEAIAGYSTDLNSLGRKGFRHFSKNFGTAEDVRIIKQDGNNFVYFKINDVANRVEYDKKGNLVYNIRYYYENLLPHAIRHIVKSTYYDYDITGVTEVNINDKTAYLMNIKNGITWKSIKILDGEMTIEQEFTER